MLEFLASAVVHRPLNILLVAVVFVIGYLIRRGAASDGGHATALLVAAAGWLLYAGWEWLVMTRTPEANIRVDLMVIWPVLVAISGWAIFRAFKG